MKILAYVPLAPETPKIYARTVTSIFRMEWPESLPVVFGRNDTPLWGKYRDLRDKHNEARAMALQGNYDALLLVENDMVLPVDALQRLVAVDADVAYGLYVNRHGWNRWLAFYDIDGWGGISYSQDPERMRDAWGNVRETKGIGLGCTLIHRNVLELLRFRNAPNDVVADDWVFALDCAEKGFTQAHDFGCVCGHIHPQGKILWPNPDAPNAHTIEFLGERNMIEITPEQPYHVSVGMDGAVVEGYVNGR